MQCIIYVGIYYIYIYGIGWMSSLYNSNLVNMPIYAHLQYEQKMQSEYKNNANKNKKFKKNYVPKAYIPL